MPCADGARQSRRILAHKALLARAEQGDKAAHAEGNTTSQRDLPPTIAAAAGVVGARSPLCCGAAMMHVE